MQLGFERNERTFLKSKHLLISIKKFRKKQEKILSMKNTITVSIKRLLTADHLVHL